MIKLLIVGILALPVHSWYDPQCCSNTDCRSVSDDDILEGDKDYIYLPLGIHFPKSMEKPSHDSKYHVCYSVGTLNGKLEYSPYCIYTRQGY